MQPAKTPRKQPPVKKLGPDDAVVQKRTTSPRNVDVDHANQVPDRNWEIGTGEDHQEAATEKKQKS
jgi:hypothetical protein